MKKISFIVLAFLIISSTFISCSKSAKTILLEGDGWSFQKPKEATKRSAEKILKFVDSETISFGNEDNYKILWMDDNTFRLSMDGNVTVFKFSDFENDKSDVAILYENEKVPETEEEWSRLQDENRVLQMVKNDESVSVPDFYVINNKKISTEKIPPAGIYIEKAPQTTTGRDDKEYLLLKVIIEEGNVKFQYGHTYDYNNSNGVEFNDITISDVGESGIFSLKGFTFWFSYEGNGVIRYQDGSGQFFVAEGEQYDKYPKTINKKDNKSNDILSEYINRASEYELIFGGEANGKLVLFEFEKNANQSGCVFNVPDGKMWTPLFFKYENFGDNYYVGIPKILTEQNENQRVGREYYYMNIYDDEATKTWWEKGSDIYIPEKKEFKSTKLSKRNRKAISGKNAIYVSGYEKDVKYIFYFIEEDI